MTAQEERRKEYEDMRDECHGYLNLVNHACRYCCGSLKRCIELAETKSATIPFTWTSTDIDKLLEEK